VKSEIRMMKVSDIVVDPVAEWLARSEDMRPYNKYFTAALKRDNDAIKSALELIAQLPTVKRYTHRVLFHLQSALADCDSTTLKLDLPYMNAAEVMQELEHRFFQLRFLIGGAKKSQHNQTV
jgi:hypothetical protein